MPRSTLAVANGAEQAARDVAANPTTRMLGRLGYAAKGIVYLIIGLLAAQAAIGGSGGATTDRKGALRAIYDQPFGKLLLIVVAVGLCGYALWSFVRAAGDTEGKGSEPKGLATRLGYAAIGVSYAALALTSLSIVRGAGSGRSSDTTTQDWTAGLLDQPFGSFLVIVAALVVAGVAAWQFQQAYTAHFQKHLGSGGMSAQARTWVVNVGRAGLGARGVVFAIMAVFLVVAAVTHDQRKAKGLGGALQELAVQPYGQILLGLVAIGLVAYGLYSLAEARYRRL